MIGMLCISSKLDKAMELIDVMPEKLKGKYLRTVVRACLRCKSLRLVKKWLFMSLS